MPRRSAWVLTALLMVTAEARGQSGRRGAVSPPVVSSVFPPGGQVGTVVEWTLAGRGMAKVKQVLVSGVGVETVGFAPEGDAKAVATVKIARDAPPGYRELRLEGPDGVSNLVLVRVDTIPQGTEVEPNDEPTQGQKLAIGEAVAGVIKATDVDHYRVEGRPGQEVTLDFEARRVGTSITPVLTVLNPRGASIAQARESRSGDHDCRLGVKIPKEGSIVVQVRDNAYTGNDAASYRLRVTTAPYATGMFPLGGPRGKPLRITASGGNLKTPVSKTITLPDTPGAIVDPGPFESPAGPIEAPMRVLIGDDEIADGPKHAPGPDPFEPFAAPIKIGQTVDGRLGRRGEVHRYAMTVKKGEKFRIRVVAEPLGSWLDSVLTVRNPAGEPLAENDDSSLNPEMQGQGRRGVNFLGVGQESGDSLLDFEAPGDGPITIEVTDRYGDGGPEYGYRLSVGASRPDFAVAVLIGNPNANGQVFQAANNRQVMIRPGMFGVFNLGIGRVPVNFLVVPQGRPGPVTVRAEGLPDGVSAQPVKVDLLGPGPKGGSPNLVNAPAKAENLVLEVAPYANPGMAEFRIVATAEIGPGRTITRIGSATIGLEAVASNVPARPITRRIERFPLRIIGEPSRQLVGPPEEPRLKTVKVPGVLLQGDRIELGLEFDQSPLADPGFQFEAKANGVGLATNTVIASGNSLPESDDEPPGDVLVRVLASPRAETGVRPVTISYTMSGGKPIVTDLVVIVRPPVELLTRAEAIAIGPGGSATIWAGVRREVGCREEVEVKVEGLPRGVKLAEPVTLKEGEAECALKLEMAPGSKPVAKATAVRVVAGVRMPRGVVSVESRNRPMIVAAPAE